MTADELEEAERVIDSVRAAMIGAEAMAIGLAVGDRRFADILHISAECEALLESLQTSLARAPQSIAEPPRAPLRVIAHSAGSAP